MIDSRGTPIEEGRKVAFNLSGQVALGTIMLAGEGGGSPYRRNIRVKLDHACAGHPAGHISRVRNQASVLVLMQTDVL